MFILDVLLIVIFLFFAIRAGIRGFVVEIFSLLAFVVGVWASINLFPFAVKLFGLLPENVSGGIKIAFYGVLFIVTYILMKLLERLVSRLIKVILLTGLNTALGIVLGFIEATLIIQVIIVILSNQDIVQYNFDSLFVQSKILGYIDTYLSIGRQFLGI